MAERKKIVLTACPDYNAQDDRKENIIGRKIAEARRKAGLTQTELASCLKEYGVELGTAAVNKWEVGKSSPNAYQLIAVAHALKILDLDYFTSVPSREKLNSTGLRKVAEYKADLIATGNYNTSRPRMVEMPVSNLETMSFDKDSILDRSGFQKMPFPECEVPENAGFGVCVSGNSMEPVYHAGDLIWIEPCRELRPGEEGVFICDGQCFLKLYHEQKMKNDGAFTDERGAVPVQLVLYSYNPNYPPVAVPSDAEFRIIGRVIR